MRCLSENVSKHVLLADIGRFNSTLMDVGTENAIKDEQQLNTWTMSWSVLMIT